LGDHLAECQVIAFFIGPHSLEERMSQKDIDEAVATATGESISLIHGLGFSLADPLEVGFDPEPRWPMVLDWDSMLPDEWPA
jgi:hypothetical protein